MNDEHKEILKQKRADEKKAILITLVVVVVIALLILAAILLLPDKTSGTVSADQTSSDQINIIVSDVPDDISETSGDVSLPDLSNEPINTTSDISDVSSADTVSDDTSESEEVVHGWVINDLGYTYIYGNCGYEQINATENTMKRYANAVNSFVSALPDNIKVYSMLAPTSVEFADIPREIYTADNFYNSSQKNTILAINEKLDKDITPINIYDTLNSHSEEYLFFRTDINWTSLAAYYAYCDFASAAGFSSVNLLDYEKQTYDGFLGRFYTATNEEALSKTPDKIEYYLTDTNNSCKLTIKNKGVTYSNYGIVGNSVSSKSNGYNVFLGMNAGYYKITTGKAEKDKLLIISDTSAAAFVPYLVSNYSEIHYINPNLYDGKISEFFNGNNINEILLLNYTTTSTRPEYASALSKLR